MAEPTLSKMERLKQRKAEIERELKALEAQEKQAARKRDARQKIIVGAAVLAHAARDEQFARILRTVLNKAVTEERNRAVIAEWIEDGATEGKIPVAAALASNENLP